MGLFEDEIPVFPTNYNEIVARISKIDPLKYGSTRNFLNGDVTYLSPYISRGVISTKLVFDSILKRGHKPAQIEKFIQELAWRDYWQQVWIAKGNTINIDLKKQQEPISNYGLPKAIVEAETGIEAIDKAIVDFYKSGYLHNHIRMYIAAICCNMGYSHWKHPAQWMYYNLLDGDWASNTLSWQWVAGLNSNKKYVANQDNINKYCNTKQKDTFLDVDYDAFTNMEIPQVLKEIVENKLVTPLPEKASLTIDTSLPTFIYNFYNLDPNWKPDLIGNRILLLEPSIFKKHPISSKSVNFMLDLSKNIEGIQIFVGEFEELNTVYELNEIYYKEHPLNSNYKGTEVPRDWMFNVTGYFPSFFGFWKKCKKQLKYEYASH